MQKNTTENTIKELDRKEAKIKAIKRGTTVTDLLNTALEKELKKILIIYIVI